MGMIFNPIFYALAVPVIMVTKPSKGFVTEGVPGCHRKHGKRHSHTPPPLKKKTLKAGLFADDR